jgi:hypothetical protein
MEMAIDSIESSDPVIIILVSNPSDSQALTRRRRQTAASGSNALISADKTCMFYAEQLVWNNVNGTKATGQNYTLNIPASSCQPNQTNNSSSVMYDTLPFFLKEIIFPLF